MKKILIRSLIIIIALVAIFYLVVIPKTVKMITDYPRFTFEYVIDNPELLESFHIGEARNPEGYGFSNYEEIDYETIYDGLNLNGWYIPSSKDSTTKTLIISHGRTSNRLKALKYLEVIKTHGLDSLYNVFIPDLRNSGKSDEAPTGMGYEFAEDIVATMTMLQIRHGQSDFVLWGFSMGAIGSVTAVNRPDLREVLAKNNLKVEKLILGSPVSNVRKMLEVGAKQRNVPRFLFGTTFEKFAKQSNGFVKQMNLSNLLKNNPLPTLILYGTSDSQTPHDILEDEISGLSNIRAERFEDADHVQIYTRPEYKDRYAYAINEFLRN